MMQKLRVTCISCSLVSSLFLRRVVQPSRAYFICHKRIFLQKEHFNNRNTLQVASNCSFKLKKIEVDKLQEVRNLTSTPNSSNMASESGPWDMVLQYWFGNPKTNEERFKLWFNSGEQGRIELQEKFADLVEKARNGELKEWEESPRGTLAVITLLDQFCRTLYTKTGNMFSHDHVALRLAKKFLPGGPFSHKDLSFYERFMLYLPLEHSENMDDQNTCYQLFEELVKDAKTEEESKFAKSGLSFAELHREVIAKYGRFPKRNAPLGRKNTPEEEAFLKDNKYPF